MDETQMCLKVSVRLLQVGRAGRDGAPARCHLFLDDADFLRLRSLAHSDGVDAPAIASFLRAAFPETRQVRQHRDTWLSSLAQ